MAIAINAVEYVFDTRITTLATNTTLGTATRHDFAAITLTIPENTSRTFRSVMVEITARDAFTAATTITDVRCGIKLGAVAFTDTDKALPLTNTSDHEMLGPMLFDVTAYFNTNFGSGTTQTCQVGVAFATSAASNMNNLCAKLYICYEADNASATKVRTARIPIQGHHTTISTSDVEIGTTGGVSDAPANQIPVLTGGGSPFLPEASVTIKQAFIEVWAVDGASAVTNFNLFIKIDTTDNARATIEQSLNSNCAFHDIFIYDTATFVATSAHALILRSSLATRFPLASAVMHVTYTYDDSTTTRELRSLVLPHEQVDADDILNIIGSATNESTLLQTVIDIEEPGTITLKQSGIFCDSSIIGGTVLKLFAPAQAERAYTHVNISLSGTYYYVRRTDHDSGWALARGKNTLLSKMYISTTASGNLTAYVILNYHCDRALNGNVSAPYIGAEIATTSATITTFSDMLRKPIIPESEYFISTVLGRAYMRSGNLSGTVTALFAERNSGETNGAGWWLKARQGAGSVESATRVSNVDTSEWWRLTHLDAARGILTATRRWRVHSTSAMTPHFMLWVTHHARRFAVAGTVTAANGTVIEVWDTVTKQRVGSGTVTSNAFSINVMSDVNPVFASSASGPTGRSADGTPGVSSFNITTTGETVTGSRFNRGFN